MKEGGPKLTCDYRPCRPVERLGLYVMVIIILIVVLELSDEIGELKTLIEALPNG